MNLNRITTLKQLALYTPILLKLHEELEGKWEPELSSHEFLGELIARFDENTYYFGEIVEGKLVYFLAGNRQDTTHVFCWLFYMNPDYRLETKKLLKDAMNFLRALGYKTLYTNSTRTESSYERWLEKFGAEKLAITYKFTL